MRSNPKQVLACLNGMRQIQLSMKMRKSTPITISTGLRLTTTNWGKHSCMSCCYNSMGNRGDYRIRWKAVCSSKYNRNRSQARRRMASLPDSGLREQTRHQAPLIEVVASSQEVEENKLQLIPIQDEVKRSGDDFVVDMQTDSRSHLFGSDPWRVCSPREMNIIRQAKQWAPGLCVVLLIPSQKASSAIERIWNKKVKRSDVDV